MERNVSKFVMYRRILHLFLLQKNLFMTLLPSVLHTMRAAFDLGSGSFKLCVAKVKKSGFLSSVEEIVLEMETPVSLGTDFYFSSEGMLSDMIQLQGLNVVTEYMRKSKELQCTEFRGIATEIFRKAKNGEEYLSKIARLGIGIRTVTQEMEAQLGYNTALVLLKNSKPEFSPVVWDSGGASFQITRMHQGNLLVYMGRLGTSVSNAILFQEVYSGKCNQKSANPVEQAYCESLVNLLQEKLPPVP